MTRMAFSIERFGLKSAVAMVIVAAAHVTVSAQPVDAARVANDAQAPRAANPPVVFAQTQSDLAPDPAARFGRLANGMTYVIYKNRTPPRAASVWMRVAAGSVMEQENQRGLAHFIEHMAFNGSRNVPRGEMVKLLERDGLKFGADTNAQTDSFETVYKLNLPNATRGIVSTALFLMRETAGNVSFDPDAIEHERGVVLGEERARATISSQASEVGLKYILSGLKYPDRVPIGKVEVLQTAKRPAFIQFYNDFYRPEYTTLVVAGDVDPGRIESEIRQRFSNWHPGPQSPAALTSFGALERRTAPEAKVFIADGLVDAMSLSWVRPPVDTVETKAKDTDDLRFLIANSILGERYSRAAKDAAFLQAGLQRDDVKNTARIYSLNIRSKDGQEHAAFDQAMKILRSYIANGPTQAEFDRTLSRLDNRFREANASARTVSTEAIVEQIFDAMASQGVVQSPAQGLAEFEELKPQFTLAAIDIAIKQLDLVEPPVLWRQGKNSMPFDEAAILSAYRIAMAQPVDSLSERETVSWPYLQFGTPSAVTSREVLRDVGATRVTFANGVVLTIKQTKFEDRSVHVAVQLGNGKLGLRPDQGASLFMATQLGRLGEGGLGKLPSEDIEEVLAGKFVGLDFSIDSNATTLRGDTTTSDFALQMQLLAAFVTDPGLRVEALDRIKGALPAAFDAYRTSPEGIYLLKAEGDRYDRDPRFSTPSVDEALAVTHADIVALVRDQLGSGPVEVTVVGDIAPDEATQAVGATLGALPPMKASVTVPGSEQLHFPTAALRRVYTHDGRPDQNLSVIAWPTTDLYSDPRRASALELLAGVLTIRELDEVRGKQGATYSASANSNMSRYFPDFGFMISRATVRPEIDDKYFKTVSDIVDDLKKHPVSADELKRAKLPLIEHLRNARNSNDYWLSVLSGTVRDKRQIEAVLRQESDLLSVTPQDLQAMAQTYLRMSSALRIQIRPREVDAAKSS